jgi:cobalt-zinc-cadmium efflux system outer membrane protein
VDRADAEIRRARAESLEDFFLFYSPYQGTDLSAQNKQSTTSWEIGLLLPIPAFNRNQGEIARARVNAVQRRVEVEQKEQEVADEVRRAATEYAASRDIVRQYEHEVLPGARELRDEKYRQFIDGTKDVGVFLSAQKDYDEILHHYLEELVRHRRSMLWLNTAVGQRLLP